MRRYPFLKGRRHRGPTRHYHGTSIHTTVIFGQVDLGVATLALKIRCADTEVWHLTTTPTSLYMFVYKLMSWNE